MLMFEIFRVICIKFYIKTKFIENFLLKKATSENSKKKSEKTIFPKSGPKLKAWHIFMILNMIIYLLLYELHLNKILRKLL